MGGGGAGLGDQGILHERNRTNPTSSLRPFCNPVQKMQRSQSELGKGKELDTAPPPTHTHRPHPGGRGSGEQAVLLCKAPQEWKGDERQKTSKIPEDTGKMMFTVLSPPDRNDGVNKNLRYKEENRLWRKKIQEGNSQHTGSFLRDFFYYIPLTGLCRDGQPNVWFLSQWLLNPL